MTVVVIVKLINCEPVFLLSNNTVLFIVAKCKRIYFLINALRKHINTKLVFKYDIYQFNCLSDKEVHMSEPMAQSV